MVAVGCLAAVGDVVYHDLLLRGARRQDLERFRVDPKLLDVEPDVVDGPDVLPVENPRGAVREAVELAVELLLVFALVGGPWTADQLAVVARVDVQTGQFGSPLDPVVVLEVQMAPATRSLDAARGLEAALRPELVEPRPRGFVDIDHRDPRDGPRQNSVAGRRFPLRTAVALRQLLPVADPLRKLETSRDGHESVPPLFCDELHISKLVGS